MEDLNEMVEELIVECFVPCCRQLGEIPIPYWLKKWIWENCKYVDGLVKRLGAEEIEYDDGLWSIEIDGKTYIIWLNEYENRITIYDDEKKAKKDFEEFFEEYAAYLEENEQQ